MTNEDMVDAFNRAYSATWEASCPITTQGEVVSADRKAVRAGIDAALATALTDAREAGRELVRLEREHLGAGPEGAIGRRDLNPLLHALNIDPEETP